MLEFTMRPSFLMVLSRQKPTSRPTNRGLVVRRCMSWIASVFSSMIWLVILSHCSSKNENLDHPTQTRGATYSDEAKFDIGQRMSIQDAGSSVSGPLSESNTINCLKDDDPSRVTIDTKDDQRLRAELKAGRKHCAWRIIGDGACKLGDLKLANKAYQNLDVSGRNYLLQRCKRFSIYLVNGYLKDMSR